MKINIQQETVAPMIALPKAAREHGVRDEKALPVRGIGFAEAVSFSSIFCKQDGQRVTDILEKIFIYKTDTYGCKKHLYAAGILL